MYTISEVSKKLNLSIYTIRYYTNKGLVPNLKHMVLMVSVFLMMMP